VNKLKKIETVEEHRRGADRFGELSPSDIERVGGGWGYPAVCAEVGSDGGIYFHGAYPPAY